MTPKLALQLIGNMGIRYISYRVKHEIEKKVGMLQKRHPILPNKKNLITLEQWRKNTPTFLYSTPNDLPSEISKESLGSLKTKAKKILNGEILYFSKEWINLGKDYDWISNPNTQFKYNNQLHWSQINDFSKESGDIKFVWEKSRFSYLLTLIRYDKYTGEDLSEFVFSEIESWIENNPINQGPNWRCSQEISLRCFNWLFALNYYKNSPNLSAKRFEDIMHVIYWSLHHVYHHIDFSRIAVRNNHAITETMFLALSNMLFPFFPETQKWARDGRKWFEQEIAYQIYEDGTFLQFSMNYHRVVIQLLSLGIQLSEQNNQPFSQTVYDRAYKSLNFLYQCLQKENGMLPNYGANDGAWFFPLSETDYRDYRPQLNALHYILTGEHLFDSDKIKEETHWIAAQKVNVSQKIERLHQRKGVLSFEKGGYYILREEESFTFIRCGNHKDRPSQADNLHIDVWVNGENILRDGGSYKYNTDTQTVAYFVGTASHNTVMVENQSQMLKGGRFIWYYWTQARKADWKNTQNEFIFEGEISAFRQLHPRATHKRIVKKKKGENVWTIVDQVTHLDGKKKQQIWNYSNKKIHIVADKALNKKETKSWHSSYYGKKKEGAADIFEFDNEITTTIKLHK